VQVCFTRHPFTCFGKINGGGCSYPYLRVLCFVNYGSTEKIMELRVIPERNIVLDHRCQYSFAVTAMQDYSTN
jgi:hypothetical protein